MRCPACDKENPEGFAYCGFCATALEEPGVTPREVRKTVTVLFCDVTGSTALGERLDPEPLRRVMTRYFESMSSVIERHGGSVEKFIGDAVMAVFGIPSVHEDDALRAVRAAWEMRQGLATLNEELLRDRGVTLEVRIGITTGEVVAGDEEIGGALATGDAVNTAARLEQAATPGQILIGEPTHRLVRDAVETSVVAPIAAKGKTEPVVAHQLEGVTAGAMGHVRRMDAPMVGRRREMAMLEQAFDRATSDRSCQLFTVLGAAGVGKSRLMDEFLGAVDGRATVLQGRCLSYGDGITYFPVIEVLKQAAELRDFDAPDELERKICAVVADEDQADLVCSRVSQLFGVDTGAASEETFWAVRRFVESIARRSPLVLVFDDLQWGESTFLDLVEHIADWSRDVPILIACMARPDLLDERPTWAGGKLNAASISLEVLSDEDAMSLIGNYLDTVDIPAGLPDRIVEAAEGNPLFVEETLAMLIDEGQLIREGGRWVTPTHLADLQVPASISALLAARLDQLSRDERAVIERASVIGKDFYRGALRSLVDDPDALDGHLLGLVRRQLIHPARSTMPGEDAFRFRHLLVRDAAYEAMPKELRADLHERFADWLEQVAGDRIAEQGEVLGYHLERAYRYRTELGPGDDSSSDLARRAAGQLADAGRRALSRGDLAAADDLLTRATDLFPSDDPALYAALNHLASVTFFMGNTSRLSLLADRRIDAARASGDPAKVMAAENLRMWDSVLTAPSSADISELRASIGRTIEVTPIDDHEALAFAYTRLSDTEWMGGSAEAIVTAAERALHHSFQAGFTAERDMIALHICEGLQRGPVSAEAIVVRMDELAVDLEGDRQAYANVIGFAASIQAARAELDDARRRVETTRAIAQDLGSSWSMLACATFAAYIDYCAGDLAPFVEASRQSIDFFRGGGDVLNLTTEQARSVGVMAELGMDDEVMSMTEEIRSKGAPFDVEIQIQWRAARGQVLARRGEVDGASSLLAEAETMARSTDFMTTLAETLFAKARALRTMHREPEAIEAADEAMSLFERKGFLSEMRHVRRFLDERP